MIQIGHCLTLIVSNRTASIVVVTRHESPRVTAAMFEENPWRYRLAGG
jgi:hypothetical protein